MILIALVNRESDRACQILKPDWAHKLVSRFIGVAMWSM